MDSKTRGLSPFTGIKADRAPMWYSGADETTKHIIEFLGAKDEHEALHEILKIDYKFLSPQYIGKELKRYDDGTFDTVWGVLRGGVHYGQALSHPLSAAETIEDIEKYSFPNPDDWRYELTPNEIEKTNGYCVMAGVGCAFFHDAIELLGMENFMVFMYDEPELIKTLVGRCADFYFEYCRRFYEANPNIIDFVMFHNDFGSQRALLMSPNHWREFFKPHLARLVDLAHKHNIYVALHSCGDIHEIIPDIIDAGFDALNPIQVNAEHMDPIALKKEHGKDIVFFGGIDENEILSNASEQEVRDETRRIIDILGHDGRYIVAPSHDFLLPEVPASNICAMYDEALKYGIGR